MNIAIIGAGAAGSFCAVQTARMLDAKDNIDVFEGGRRALAKVAVTGGGRCNLTNSFRRVSSLASVYPRGERLMKRALRQWSHEDTMRWFEGEGVRLVTQDDECVFPVSQNAMQIVNILLDGMADAGVRLHLSHRVEDIVPCGDGYEIRFADTQQTPYKADKVVIAVGGCPQVERLRFMRHLDVDIVPPVPSLYTLCISDKGLCSLMGTVTDNVTLSVAGTKFRSVGTLLITHWGISGPATLVLSSYAARYLAEHGYVATLCINWMGDSDEESVRRTVEQIGARHPQRLVTTERPQSLSLNLWRYLTMRSGITPDTKWADVSGKKFNRLVSTLTSDTYQISGKGQYKEEFVTCGGVSLHSIDIGTLEAKRHPGVYLAGEVLDVDAVTGGFNLQAAWSMGHIVATGIANTAGQCCASKEI